MKCETEQHTVKWTKEEMFKENMLKWTEHNHFEYANVCLNFVEIQHLVLCFVVFSFMH